MPIYREILQTGKWAGVEVNILDEVPNGRSLQNGEFFLLRSSWMMGGEPRPIRRQPRGDDHAFMFGRPRQIGDILTRNARCRRNRCSCSEDMCFEIFASKCHDICLYHFRCSPIRGREVPVHTAPLGFRDGDHDGEAAAAIVAAPAAGDGADAAAAVAA